MTNQLPKVSIAIIAYNQESFIEEAIRGAVDQDYENLEVIVSDDGSTDRTLKIAEDLQKEYGPEKLKLISGSNLGIAGNTNRALSLVTGDYICFQGGDDIYLQGKIRKQVEFMKRHPQCVMSYHQAEAFDSLTRRHLYYFSEDFIDGGVGDFLERGSFFLSITAMIKTKWLPKNGFNPDLPIASDWLYFSKVLYNSREELLFMPGIYCRYRRHTENVTSQSDSGESFIALEIMRRQMPEMTTHLNRSEAFRAISGAYRSEISFFQLAYHLFKSPKATAWAVIPSIKIARRLINQGSKKKMAQRVGLSHDN